MFVLPCNKAGYILCTFVPANLGTVNSHADSCSNTCVCITSAISAMFIADLVVGLMDY